MKKDIAYLFTGVIYQKKFEDEYLDVLSREFGEVLMQSDTIPFDFTDYYAGEMGEDLVRKWILFDYRIRQDLIADIKNKTIQIEKGFFSFGGKRKVNIDPGYITPSKIVLPTTKDCAHRIYLRDGIYAEVTLIFFRGVWTPLKWTYRDYCSRTGLDFFKKCREYLMKEKTKEVWSME